MKALKTFGFLGGSNAAAETPPEDGRVVELFRSRAELRKQHDELGAEMQRLRDRLKQQEAATGRVQEMFESLEKRLESADTGLSTLVFYHLRALWGDGREIIGLLVQDLAAKQEERERKALALEGNRKQFQQRQARRTAAAPGGVAHGRGAPATGRRSTRGSPSSTSGGIAGSGPRSPAQRPGAAGRGRMPPKPTSLGRARALRTDREGGRRRISGHFRRSQARDQSRRDRLRRSVVPAPGAHHAGGVGARRHVAARVD